MLIAIIVFGPFIGAAAAAAIGRWNEKAGEYAALFLTAAVLGLTLVLARSAGSDTLYPSEQNAVGQSLVFPESFREAALPCVSPVSGRSTL